MSPAALISPCGAVTRIIKPSAANPHSAIAGKMSIARATQDAADRRFTAPEQ
jgi:hypothetical protein